MTKTALKLTKRILDNIDLSRGRHYLWDKELKGFGVQVELSSTRTFFIRYIPKGLGREGKRKFYKIGRYGDLTVDEARFQAKTLLGAVAAGEDPSELKQEMKRDYVTQKNSLTFKELAEKFISDHIDVRRKERTAINYALLLRKHAYPHLADKKANLVILSDIITLHSQMRANPHNANRLIAVISSLYSFAMKLNLVQLDKNPAVGVEKYKEESRERYLTQDELERLGNSLEEAETIGLPWKVGNSASHSKHLAKDWQNIRQPVDKNAIDAIRLLLFTGARLREILDLKWKYVDLDRGLLFLPDSKTGKKTIVLSQSALDIILSLRDGLNPEGYVIKSEVEGKPKADLKRPWKAIQFHANLEGVRLHDLRHTFASIGAGSSLGLPIVGKLLGHSQPQTTARYAHLDADPLKRATDIIGAQLAASLWKRRTQHK